ncbi:hypothetical protein CVT25_005383 [Psilocybe cyanescens]|uniref:Uncharacterized protein n=1 Tax=Psilocybe cyanescens TaxID=93625 RepID=A0A409XW43_PSICY|nr:hypothetical protein CVT25_005383 [Psilocybe cyanescens]
MPVGTPVNFPDVPDFGGDDNFAPEPKIAPNDPNVIPQPQLVPNNVPATPQPPVALPPPDNTQIIPILPEHVQQHTAPVQALVCTPHVSRLPKSTIEPSRHSTRAPKPPSEWWKVAPAPSSAADNDKSNLCLDDDMDKVQFAGAASTSDPHNYKQAMKSDDSD